MKVIERLGNSNQYPNLTVCDWSEDYPNLKDKFTVNLYAISNSNMHGDFAPKFGESHLFMFLFETFEDASDAAHKIFSGEARPLDYVEHMDRPEYACCL